jgi:hypothetical protein
MCWFDLRVCLVGMLTDWLQDETLDSAVPLEVMFHVSTMLQHSINPQQLDRKVCFLSPLFVGVRMCGSEDVWDGGGLSRSERSDMTALLQRHLGNDMVILVFNEVKLLSLSL